MRKAAFCLIALALMLAPACCRADEAKVPTAILVKIVVGEGDPDAAKRKVLGEPNLATLLGRPCSFQTGGEILSNPQDPTSPVLQCGTVLRAHLHKAKPGHVKGELRLEVTHNADSADPQLVNATGVVIQQAGVFKLGQTYRLVSREPATWAEVTISDANEMALPARR